MDLCYTENIRHKNGREWKKMYDVIIIGSGPAGMSAAVYAKRAGMKLLLIEKSPVSGGQVLNTYEVDNYLGIPGINGYDLSMKFKEHVEKLNCEVLEAEVEKLELQSAVKKVCTEQGDFEAKNIIIATGASHAHLNVPGEEELSGMGVSYCATCDGAFFRGKTVAVVGGGDVAVEDAIFLARTCEKVYVIHRRDELRAAKILQEELFALPNVEVLWDTVVTEICGNDMVEKLQIRNVKTEENSELPVQGIFIAVGIHPDTDLVKEELECNDAGYICAGEDGATNISGVFAAGDVREKPLRQIITAVADGANAAISASKNVNY